MGMILEFFTKNLWAIVVAGVTLVFAVGGFYRYVTNKLANHTTTLKDLSDNSASKQSVRDLNTDFKNHKESVTDSLEKQREHTDGDHDECIRIIGGLEKDLTRLQSEVEHAQKSVDGHQSTIREIFNKLDQIKKDFVSTDRYNSDQAKIKQVN